jgi:hypothetical protein
VIRPTARFIMHTVASLVAVTAIVIAVLAWRLSGGPISLAVLTPYVQDALSQTESPYQVEFADTVLTWAGWERALDIRIVDVRVVGADGVVAASAPEISLSLSVAAMWRGLVAPTVLEVIAPKITLVRGVDGRFEFGLGEESGASGDLAGLLFADLLAPPDPVREMGYLERVSIIAGDLAIIDRQLDRRWHAPHATIVLSRDGEGVGVTADLAVDIAGRLTNFDIGARYSGSWPDAHVGIEFTDLRPEWFATEFPGLEQLAGSRFPVSGRLELVLDDDLGLREIGFNLKADAGDLALGQLYDEPVAIAQASIIGSVALTEEHLQIDSAVVDFWGPKLALEGLVEGFNDEPLIAAGITISDLPIDDLAQFWPAHLAPAARDWVVGNIAMGVIIKSQTTLHLKPGDLALPRLPAQAVYTTIEVEGATVNYLDPLPPVTGVDGVVTITGDTLEARTWSGEVEGVTAKETLLTINNLGGHEEMTVDADLSGAVSDVLGILAHPFLGYPQRLGVSPGDVAGTARIGFRVVFPLLKDLLLEDVKINAVANLEDIAIAATPDRPAISGGLLRLALDNSGMDVNGTLALNGVPGDAIWRENFATDAAFDRRYSFAGRFIDSQRLALGLPGGDYVTGPADMGLEILDLPDGNRQWRISADLVDTMTRIPEIYWQKPIGTEGLVELEFLSGPRILQTTGTFNLAAGDLAAQGRAGIDAETLELAWLELDRLAFGENDVRAALLFDMGDGYRIGIEGPSLDLRPYLDDYDTDGPLPELQLSADLDRVITRNGQSFQNVKAELRFTGDRWEAMNVDGLLAGGKHLNVRIGREVDSRFFFMGSDDGGEFLRALDIFDDAVGGTLTVDALFDPTGIDGAVAGELNIQGFKVVNAPILARILSVASLIGVFDLLKGEGLPFSELVVPFVKRGDVLEIDDAYARGATIGFTFKGQVDIVADTADLKGTIVPAYLINNFWEKIPILGPLLTGGEEGGGVFAMTYTLSGPLSDPEVKVNPLPALAPGILRKLFDLEELAPSDDEEVSPDNEPQR